MEEILHQMVGSLSHYLQGLLHPGWCRISSINRSLLEDFHFFLKPHFSMNRILNQFCGRSVMFTSSPGTLGNMNPMCLKQPPTRSVGIYPFNLGSVFWKFVVFLPKITMFNIYLDLPFVCKTCAEIHPKNLQYHLEDPGMQIPLLFVDPTQRSPTGFKPTAAGWTWARRRG